ncbi:MAG: 50S ribosomal protein L1 [Candidatus Methanomethylicia archaeon]
MSSLGEKLMEAIEKSKRASKKRNFIQSIEIIINLENVDLKNPENRINEKIIFPNPINKQVKICVFGDGDFALKAKEAGANTIIGRDDIEKLALNKKEIKKLSETHDIFIARADYMPIVGKFLGSILGPRNKMPEPVPPSGDITSIINKARNTAWIRMRNQPIIQCKIGTEDMPTKQLLENALNVISLVERKFKSLRIIQSIYVKTTMGEAIKVTL